MAWTRRSLMRSIAVAIGAAVPGTAALARQSRSSSLWQAYQDTLKGAKYVDLTHTLTPQIPIWSGFAEPNFSPAQNPSTGEIYTPEKDGFWATHYNIPADQYGTQLDPPAHWAPEYPAIDELPPTFAVRPLVVISIVDQVEKDPGYALQVSDIKAFEHRHGRVPEGSVVFVRSDWSKDWPDPALATRTPFPAVSLDALKFLHEQRKILMHGHEPLDTDNTPNLEGEAWLMHHGYTQAEGVAHLDKVPAIGALVTIGYPKFKGGTGGLARYVAICPPDWKHGVTIADSPGAPLPAADSKLHWDREAGTRVR